MENENENQLLMIQFCVMNFFSFLYRSLACSFTFHRLLPFFHHPYYLPKKKVVCYCRAEVIIDQFIEFPVQFTLISCDIKLDTAANHCHDTELKHLSQ